MPHSLIQKPIWPTLRGNRLHIMNGFCLPILKIKPILKTRIFDYVGIIAVVNPMDHVTSLNGYRHL